MSIESGYTATLDVMRRSGRLTVVFETWEGGDPTSSDTRHRNPVTRKETARAAGKRSRSNVTLTRECDAEMWALRAELDAAVDLDPSLVTKQMVDERDTVVGSPLTLPGIIRNITWPKYDLSGESVGMVSVEVGVDE